MSLYINWGSKECLQGNGLFISIRSMPGEFSYEDYIFPFCPDN